MLLTNKVVQLIEENIRLKKENEELIEDRELMLADIKEFKKRLNFY